MKHSIPCKIDVLHTLGETAWIISLAAEAVPDAVILLAALLYEKLPRIKILDKCKAAEISNSQEGYSLSLDGEKIAVTKIWLEAVLSDLLNVCLNGWSMTAHIDEEFETISVCIAVLPPE